MAAVLPGGDLHPRKESALSPAAHPSGHQTAECTSPVGDKDELGKLYCAACKGLMGHHAAAKASKCREIRDGLKKGVLTTASARARRLQRNRVEQHDTRVENCCRHRRLEQPSVEAGRQDIVRPRQGSLSEVPAVPHSKNTAVLIRSVARRNLRVQSRTVH